MIKHYGGELGVFDYDDTEFKAEFDYRGRYLHYIGMGKRVRLPKGCTNCRFMFSDYPYTSIDLTEFDTTGVVNMQSMFESANRLENIDVSRFNTLVVTDMSRMFKDCVYLKYVDMSNFNTSKLYRVPEMFRDCCSLQNIVLSDNFFRNIVSSYAMFRGCRNLTDIDLSSFEENNGVIDLSKMFEYCVKLKTLDMSLINVQSLYTSLSVCEKCMNLESISLYGSKIKLRPLWDKSEFRVSDISRMLGRCDSLKYIELDRAAVINSNEEANFNELEVLL